MLFLMSLPLYFKSIEDKNVMNKHLCADLTSKFVLLFLQPSTIVKLKNKILSMEALLVTQEKRLTSGFKNLKEKVTAMEKMANQAQIEFENGTRECS